MKMLKTTVFALAIGAMMVQPAVMQAKEKSPLAKIFDATGEFIRWGFEGMGMAVWDAGTMVNRRLGNKPVIGLVGLTALAIAFAPENGAKLVKYAGMQCLVHAYSCLKCDRAFLMLVAGYCYRSVTRG